MSQRRSTLGLADPNTLHGGGSSSNSGGASGIPVPASAHKSQAFIGASQQHGPPVSSQHSAMRASRSSLAPMRSQGGPLSSQGSGMSGAGSMGGSVAGSAGLGSSIGPSAGASVRGYSEEALTTPRVGTSVRGLGASHMRHSTASGGMGRQSLAVQSTPNQQRVFGRQSLAHNTFRPEPPAMKDPRPLRNGAFRGQMEANVKDFVEKTGFTMAGWTNKTIHEPTQQAFVNMFRHVYTHCVDPNYRFGSEAKKFEEEVIMLMKDVKYPFVDDLSKTRLTSAGSQQNWPICLGMLDWIVRLGTHAADIGCGPLQRDDEEDNDLFYRYLWRCYSKFWQGEDTFPEEYDELRAIYDERMEGLRNEETALEKESAKLDVELLELEAESPLVHEQREDEILQSDKAKFSKYNEEVLATRLEKLAMTVEKLKQAVVDSVDELAAKEQERRSLQAQVDAQDMSAEEYERLHGERDHIIKQLAEIARQAQIVTKSNWQVEIDVQRRQSAVEALMSVFNEIGDRVKFLPLTMRRSASSRNASNDDEEEELDKIELVPANEETLLPKGLDIKRDIKPAIQGLRQATNATFKSVTDAKIALQDEQENLLERLATLQAEIRSEQERLNTLRDQIEELTANSGVEMEMLAQDYARRERQLGAVESAGRVALQEANMTYEAMVDELENARQAIAENKQRQLSDVANALGELDRLQQRVHDGIERIEEAVLAIEE
ncbi:kinetochore-associated Ndc80 complex subunit ndc80 [Tilletia horrida]|uniref:Kinetochore protein NDC80 n=1 Tax=Tilletia horrida TaxID=155126 RepID=A0AAN6JJP3_9BASI|nr:kinetochore-associated Ndc80 complex subunit ndc80 [Tilletia horrida]KAK0530463.1 kinetochore-associated Ndc80 complex subunit ndc80 [Tilletia horrida]